MKSKTFGIFVTAFVVLMAISITLVVFIEYAKEVFPENITVQSEGVTETILPIRDLRLNPSESKDYSINLVCEATGSYLVTLDFLETVDGGMKEFVDVSVTVGGALTYSGRLSELIAGEARAEFETELSATEPVVITVHYEMPREIGNEAQGTYADFDVRLAIKKT